MLEKLKWIKCQGTTGKVDPSPQFLAEEKFSFQRNIAQTSAEFFEEIIFSYLEDIKRDKALTVRTAFFNNNGHLKRAR